MNRLRLAIVGFGRLGQACAHALREAPDCELTGVVRRNHGALSEAAHRHRVPAVVGAGWQPGALPLLQRVFETLIPRGRTETSAHAGLTLHRTAALEGIAGVQAALACERRAADGRPQRYLYVQLESNASFAEVERRVRADPLYAGEETALFQVDDVAALEAAASGIVLERRGTAGADAHQSLLLEARFDAVRFAARVMLDAARQLPRLRPGAHAWLPRA